MSKNSWISLNFKRPGTDFSICDVAVEREWSRGSSSDSSWWRQWRQTNSVLQCCRPLQNAQHQKNDTHRLVLIVRVCFLNALLLFLFFSRPRSEGWPHCGRTFSIEIISSKYTRHVVYVKPQSTKSINLWKFDGAVVHPREAPYNGNNLFA